MQKDCHIQSGMSATAEQTTEVLALNSKNIKTKNEMRSWRL